MGRIRMDFSPNTLLDLYYLMLLSRTFEERLAILYRQGKALGGIFSGIGQEAVTVGTTFDLEAEDVVFPLHRDVGVCLARGLSPARLLAQIQGKADGPSGGKADYLHSGDPSLGIYGSTSMLASSLPIACGAALAFKLKLTNNVAVAYIGEGGTSRGDFHEALNFAGVQRLPVIFVVENNLYAYSTPFEKQTAAPDIASRGAVYGMPGRVCAGNDVIEVRQVMAEAVERARDWLGPTLIECKTYRWHGHSEHDEAAYRESEEFLEWKSRDPLPRVEAYLRERDILKDDIAEDFHTRTQAEIEEAVKFSDASPYPEPEEAMKNLFVEEDQ